MINVYYLIPYITLKNPPRAVYQDEQVRLEIITASETNRDAHNQRIIFNKKGVFLLTLSGTKPVTKNGVDMEIFTRRDSLQYDDWKKYTVIRIYTIMEDGSIVPYRTFHVEKPTNTTLLIR
jgi:hypothetical protein